MMSAGLWGFPVDIGHDLIQTQVLCSKRCGFVKTQVHRKPILELGTSFMLESGTGHGAMSFFIDDLKHSESMIDDKMNE